MRQAQHSLEIQTKGRSLVDVTSQVRRWLETLEPRTGRLTVFLQHTSASLIIQENADTEVQRDLERFFSRLVPDGDPLFRHDAEGPDDMPAHVRSALTATQLAIPVTNGALALGTWQAIYLYEHRVAAHRRRMVLHYVGD
jgi:secondary thiamine-phosphate synthase enzyme